MSEEDKKSSSENEVQIEHTDAKKEEIKPLVPEKAKTPIKEKSVATNSAKKSDKKPKEKKPKQKKEIIKPIKKDRKVDLEAYKQAELLLNKKTSRKKPKTKTEKPEIKSEVKEAPKQNENVEKITSSD